MKKFLLDILKCFKSNAPRLSPAMQKRHDRFLKRMNKKGRKLHPNKYWIVHDVGYGKRGLKNMVKTFLIVRSM